MLASNTILARTKAVHGLYDPPGLIVVGLGWARMRVVRGEAGRMAEKRRTTHT